MVSKKENQKLGTCVIIINSKNEVLLGKRLSVQVLRDHYSLPGGSLEPGESPVAGGRREAFEETSIRVKKPFLLAIVIDHLGPPTNDYIHFGILCTKFTGTPTLTEPDKCAGWEWFPLDKLPSPIIPAHQAIINYYASCKFSPKLEVLEISSRS